MEWLSAITPTSENDKYLRVVVAIMLLIWNIFVSTRLDYPYPSSLIEGYAIPLTRVGLLGLVLLSAYWCPSVGIMAAFAYVSLGADTLLFVNNQ